MLALSTAEENYLKCIYHLTQKEEGVISTNEIAAAIKTKPASVSDMLKKLAEKEILMYTKYHGAGLTPLGKKTALQVIRRNRLWEVFLVDKLRFQWDQVHEVAEQLEHVRSPLLIRRLDEYLGFPKFDPHGDPIPDESGELHSSPRTILQDMKEGARGKIVAVNDNSAAFLRYLDKVGAYIGAKVEILDKVEFDGSLEIRLDEGKKVFVSKEVAANIYIQAFEN
ncbi:metal-dependent transcriptional regulator [Pleomorphovibrio marinus]|uniref:metal-dependent transcriptional regulator n=1 Tax=Pleomorphovibrio marinus TaxID=2164132 RepID=UPI000E0B456D|nr:metal-dependent transcriptional regulator [Pleomorphovibrio marinus]